MGRGIVRDGKGKLVFAFYKEFGEINVLEAEASTLALGLALFKKRKITNLTIEVDSASLVQLIRRKNGKWPLCLVLQKIKALLQGLEAPINHVWRQANSVANGLAALSLSNDMVYNSHQQLPKRIIGLIASDRNSIPTIRVQHVRE